MSSKISIITVNLNNAAGLEQTIKSVVAQAYPFEFIVIDGSSVDGSKQVIEKYNSHIAHSVSEKDNGIYHAMNKGIVKATGDYLLFLNSGDTLIGEHALQTMINDGNDADLIYGDIIQQEEEVSRDIVFPDKLTFKFFFLNSLPHAATLIKRQLFSIVGNYNEQLKIVSDWLFFMLAINKHNCSYKHVPVFIANFTLGGSSSQHERVNKEREQVLKDYFPTFIDDYDELFSIWNELQAARKQLGYRVHKKIRKLL